jgi:xanthosine utilization system XapX-like protein
MTGATVPGLAAGVIYVVIALATAAPAMTAITGGIVVAALAVAIGFLIRAAYNRGAASP